MFWIRQLLFIVVIYFLLVYANDVFFTFRVNQSFIIFQILILVNVTIFSMFVFGRSTLKALYDISFVNLKTILVDKVFIVDCAKLYYAKGALSLESKLKKTNDSVVHKAIHLLVDQVSINQFERELDLEINYIKRKLKRTKSLIIFIFINYLAINIIYLLSILLMNELVSVNILLECLSFITIVFVGVFFPLYHLIDQYQNRKMMTNEIYKLGFISIINQMSSRQIEMSISIELDI
ncbi:MAG: hypothetical protein HRU38_08205 [Saccharospirillaceae bacterium]|nr:hypothetical protein [Pseudomonadales bacterium]NRB78636.1 hypothetical protein [Saccharospirillaceae bacterium]